MSPSRDIRVLLHIFQRESSAWLFCENLLPDANLSSTSWSIKSIMTSFVPLTTTHPYWRPEIEIKRKTCPGSSQFLKFYGFNLVFISPSQKDSHFDTSWKSVFILLCDSFIVLLFQELITFLLFSHKWLGIECQHVDRKDSWPSDH